MSPPFSDERSAFLKELAERLFPQEVEIIPTEEEWHELNRACLSIHTNPKTNVVEKTWASSVKDCVRGFIVEMAARQLLGINRRIQTSIDVKDPQSYNHDVVYGGRKIEVKSITPGHEGKEMASYHIRSSSTLLKHRDELAAIVFGAWRPVGDGFSVDFRWVLAAEFFGPPHCYRSIDEYWRANPYTNRRLRETDACLWNRRILTGITFED